jgi:hypothetical protein
MSGGDWLVLGFVVIAFVLLVGPLRWWARWCERKTAQHDAFPHVKLPHDDHDSQPPRRAR